MPFLVNLSYCLTGGLKPSSWPIGVSKWDARLVFGPPIGQWEGPIGQLEAPVQWTGDIGEPEGPVHTRVKHFRPNKKCEIVDTDEEENLVAPSVERSIVVAVELRSPLAQFPFIRYVEAQIFTA